MNPNRLRSYILCILLGLASNAVAQEFFHDSFDDGDAEDGDPVEWIAGMFENIGDFTSGERSARSDEHFGDYLWTPAGTNMGATVFEYSYSDVSLHTQVRLLGPARANSSSIYICARDDGYCAGLTPGGKEMLLWSLSKAISGGGADKGFLHRQATTLDVTEADVHLKFDLLEDSLSLSAWHEGDAQPAVPQVIFNDSSAATGRVGLFHNHDGTGTQALFRFYEATPLAPPDFDGSGTLDLGDVNRLSLEIASGLSGTAFDLNEDGQVDQLDLGVWAKDLRNTWMGDANLDGEFNSTDLVTVFQAGKYEGEEVALWEEGDWNADQRFDSGDLVAAFQDGGYEMGPLVAAGAVPEPTTMLAGWLALVALVKTSRSRRSKHSCFKLDGRARK